MIEGEGEGQGMNKMMENTKRGRRAYDNLKQLEKGHACLLGS